MLKSRLTAAAVMLAIASAAQADVAVNAAWVSDYDWRGVPQSEINDAFQLSGTWTGNSGIYVGVWGSTLYPHADAVELDVFAGYAGDIGDSGLGYDVGLNYYTYPNWTTDANFVEAYAGLSYGVFGAKVWYSPEFGGNGGDSSVYLEGNATVPLDSRLNLLAHVGYSTGDGIETYYGSGQDSYVDWSVGVGYDVGNFSTFLKYVDGSDNDAVGDYGSRVVFGISTTLPWSE